MKYIFGLSSWAPCIAKPEYLTCHFSFNGIDYFIRNDGDISAYNHGAGYTEEYAKDHQLPDEVHTAAVMWLKMGWAGPAYKFLDGIFNGQV